MKQANQDRGTLLLALVAGNLSINGTFAALFSSIVPFSVFPIISTGADGFTACINVILIALCR